MTTNQYRKQIAICAALFVLMTVNVVVNLILGEWFNYVSAAMGAVVAVLQIVMIFRWLKLYRKERGFDP
jgi:membrane protein YdbS with pleckstrin-like domain